MGVVQVKDHEVYGINLGTAPAAHDAPAHYELANGMDALDVMRASFTPDMYMGFLVGNVIKYALRFRRKGQLVSDVDKLADYAAMLSQYVHELKED